MENRIMPLISVIVPIYKVEPYLSGCIESILGQTYRNLEIILVDDGSPDRCGEICDMYAEKDSRIIVIHQPNKGLSGARNAGLDRASGEYIGFVDSDDTIQPDMMEKMLVACIDNNAEISVCNRNIVTEDGEVHPRPSIRKQPYVMNSREALIEMNSHTSFDMAAWDKLYERRLWEGVRFPCGKLSEDFFVMFYLLDRADHIVWVPDHLYNYLLRENSISRNDHISQDFVDASKLQREFIRVHYPDIEYVGSSAYASACLTVYDYYVKRGIRCPRDIQDGYSAGVRSCLVSSLKNPHWGVEKKLQMLFFCASPRLYDVAFRLYKKYMEKW